MMTHKRLIAYRAIVRSI